MKKILMLGIVFILAVSIVSAQCQVTVQSESTRQFLKEVPTINQALKVCPQELPFPLSYIFKNQKVVTIIQMIDGSTETIIAETQNGFLMGLTWGGTGTGYTVTITECGFDTALKNGNSFGVYAYLYQQNQLSISANGIGKRITLLVLSPFISSAANKLQTPVTIECSDQPAPQNPGAVLPGGKPDNCDDTFHPGHPGYSENKALWDGYSLDADKVCQTQTGTGVPTPNTCVHTVQLSQGGFPYYLCWYNE
jgi:hypothetical protein